MPKFEYTTTPSIGTDLDAMGEDGWEMAAVESASIYWKRALPEGGTIHHEIHATLKQLAANSAPGSHAAEQRAQPTQATGKADVTGGKPSGSNQPADAVHPAGDRPLGRNEQGPRPESAPRTAETANAGARGTAEPMPRGHTPPRDK